MIEIFNISLLPKWVKIPTKYLKLIRDEKDEFLPWYLIDKQQFSIRYEGMKNRYPSRNLIPFARRDDNDDVACWDSLSPDSVFIIHDFASPGYEERCVFPTFEDWYQFALNESDNDQFLV